MQQLVMTRGRPLLGVKIHDHHDASHDGEAMGRFVIFALLPKIVQSTKPNHF